MNRLAVIGSTGSIGRSTLAVADAHPDRVRVVALAAGENVRRFADQVERFNPALATMATDGALQSLHADLQGRRLSRLPALTAGAAGLLAVATHPDVDTVLFASSGTASLDAVLAAIRAGKRIALANKEILVMAGALVMEAARRQAVSVLPVDSEHNAIHQCLHGRPLDQIRRLILTASGGPFRGLSRSALEAVTKDDALRHPTWNMGPKITIDSATLMNKGLEVIEARWLFDVRAGQHFRGRPSAVHRSLDGRVRGRLDRRADGRYRYAIAHTVRVVLSGSLGGRRSGARPHPVRPAHVRAGGQGRLSLPGFGVPGALRGCGSADCAERGQRSRGRGLPGRQACHSRRFPS